MKRHFYLVSLLFTSLFYSQSILVDETYSANDLVNLLMQNSCSQISNISVSNGNSVGYFNKNGSNFSLNEGILIRTGDVTFTQGSYTGNNLDSNLNNNTDVYLQNLSNTNSGTTTPILDVAFLEFDFTPISDSFSFNFLFASNEYGSQQCLSNDIFAFVLTDLSTNVSSNLAIVPGSNDPVSVKSIRNSAFNSNCSSSNAVFFDTYTVNNPSISTLNMRGYTKVLTASSSVIPNNTYHLKLVIADYGDIEYDSAIFIEAGSFSDNFSLGDDQYYCNGDNFILNTGLDNSFSYQWLLNGTIIPGENNSSYIVTQPGEYTVIIDNATCHIEDTIEFFQLNVVLQDIISCYNNGNAVDFNLEESINSSSIVPSNYQLFYYSSLADVASNNPIPQSDVSNFQSLGQPIYVKILNTTTGFYCDTIYTFNLEILPEILLQDITAFACANETSYDLTLHLSSLLNGMSGNFSVYYYTSLSAAQNYSATNIGITPETANLSGTSSPNIFYVRFHFNENTNCYAIATITINKYDLPLVDTINTQIGCSQITLPTITNGFYFTESQGGGTNLGQGGAIIDEGGTYYIYVGPDSNGCFNESSFIVFLIDEYEIPHDYCGQFTVPVVPYDVGNYYDAPNGSGNIIPAGTVFENTSGSSIIQPIYFYSDYEGPVCRDELWEIYIHPVPLVDILPDVTNCDSFVFPNLLNGLHYEVVGNFPDIGILNLGLYYPGDILILNGTTATYDITIFNELLHTTSTGDTQKCYNTSSFQLNLIDTSSFTEIEICGSFLLPEITFGNYYDQPNGTGTIIDPSIPITTSQLVYYYTNTSELPNCTNNLNYDITILPLPEIDTINSGLYCGEFTLPALTNGNYYTLPGGPLTPNQIQLNPYQVIDLTGLDLQPGTYYIYNGPNEYGCSNENSFTINIAPLPLTDSVIDQLTCSTYTIGTATNGTFYTAPNGPYGSGAIVDPNEVFDYTNTFYIYNEDPISGCVVDNAFTIFYNAIELPDFPDQDVCEYENYALPILTHTPPEPSINYTINYYLDANGNGIPGDSGDTIIPAGTIFNTPNTVTTVYVVARNTGRFGLFCEEVDTITITVSETPDLSIHPADLISINNSNYCGDFTLPNLNDPTVNYTVNYHSQPGGNINTIINQSDYTYSVSPDETPQTFDVWVYAFATNNNNCFDEMHLQFTIFPRPTFTVQGGIICKDPISNITLEPFLLESGLNANEFTVEWHLNGNQVGTGVNYLATEAGVYDVIPIMITTEIPPNCNYIPTQAIVLESSTAIASVDVTLPFENVANAIVTIENGLGEYIYQLDDFDFQTSNEFTNISSGEHSITVRDILGYCGDFLLDFTVVKYPNYFTPNGDGVQDFWNIFDLRKDHPEAVISIFDRYGKFLKQISPLGNGWDGKYNGKEMPSTDYWFTVDYIYNNEPKVFKAHFSLLR